MKILAFGNPLLKEDNIALKLLPKLKKLFPQHEFKEFDSSEGLESEGKNLTIIDAVQGIDKVEVLTEKDLNKIETSKIYSMHDFDLGYNLKLLKKAKLLKKFTIFGIPQKMKKKDALRQLKKKIKKAFEKNS